MTTYGYARVSTDGQSVAAQEAQLRAAGCAKVYAEKISGKATDGRAELAKVIRRLEHDDVLVVVRLDRLARNTRDLLNLLHDLAQRGVGFKSLNDPWCDTTSMHGELMVTLLAGISTFERRLILARTDEGRKRAKARGVKFGRPPPSQPTNARKRSSGSPMGKRKLMSLDPLMWGRQPYPDWQQASALSPWPQARETTSIGPSTTSIEINR
jgi:DNA invertase Pin-like site-specific DNA recombinase